MQQEEWKNNLFFHFLAARSYIVKVVTSNNDYEYLKLIKQ